MAHHEEQSTSAIEHMLEILCEQGLGAMAQSMQTLLNAATKLERAAFLGAGPGERSEERIGHANGFRGKTVRSRIGELALRPQVAHDLRGAFHANGGVEAKERIAKLVDTYRRPPRGWPSGSR